MRKILVAVSGGMSSATLLARAVANVGVRNVNAVTFNTAKNKRWNNFAAMLVCEHFEVPFSLIDIQEVFIENAPKNPILVEALRIFCNFRFDECWIGFHMGSSPHYQKSSPEQFNKWKTEFLDKTHYHCDLVAPFLHDTRASIIDAGLTYQMKVPYFHTTNCTRMNGFLECGECESCVEKNLAFQKNHMITPKFQW